MGSSMWLIIWAYSFWKLLDTLMRKYKNIHWDDCLIWYNLQVKKKIYNFSKYESVQCPADVLWNCVAKEQV